MTKLSKSDERESTQQVVLLTIDESSETQRVDNFLAKHFQDVPKSHLYQILRSGQVRVNKKRIDPSYKLQLGDVIRIPPIHSKGKTQARVNPTRPILQSSIIYEDDAILVINKPAGIAVHGGSGISKGVIEQFRSERPTAKFLELVHRLDKETSGVLMLAKKRSALVALQDQIRKHKTDKRYLIMVEGQWRNQQQKVKLHLQKHTLANGERKVTVVNALHQHDDADIQHSETVFYLKQRNSHYSLLEALLITGRTHQLRVQLAHLKHPILGDEKYGNFELNKKLQKQGLKRMFLHSYQTTIHHPVSGELLTLLAPLPTELEYFVDLQRFE